MDVAAALTTLPTERTERADEQPHHISLTDRGTWRDAGLVWLGLHALLLALTYLGWLLPIAYAPRLPHAVWTQPYLPWAVNFDGTSYAPIARDGYVTLAQPAFYPLYPLLERAATILTLGHLGVAGLLVANVCCLGAFVLLRVLAERELGRDAARRTLIALVIFPTALFLTAAYAESLFLLLSLAAFLALRAHRWPLTGVFIALATLTRPLGILLLAAVAGELWTTSPRLREAAAHPLASLRTLRLPSVSNLSASVSVNSVPSVVKSLLSASAFSASSALKLCSTFALPLLALAGYFAFLDARFGSFFTATHAEAGGWGRYLSWPWDGFARATRALFTVRGPMEVHAFLDIVFTLIFLGLTIAMLRVLPLAYVAYTVATLALVLLTPIHYADWAALHSNSRFMMAVFPLFLLIGCWRPSRTVSIALLLASLWMLAVFTLSFVNGSWVA